MTGSNKRALYSLRTGLNKNLEGFDLSTISSLVLDAYQDLREAGYFDEYLGYYCVDAGDVTGHIRNPANDILIKSRKDHLWPLKDGLTNCTEDDLFDIIEYLFTVISKPLEGHFHSYNDCGMHWTKFDKKQGEEDFIGRINDILINYKRPFELSGDGEILSKPEAGLGEIFKAPPRTRDANVKGRIEAAVLRFRRHGSTMDDRRQAVRDLADVLEYLRPKMKEILLQKDENDLFNIANNFAIRHHNERQKTKYEESLWMSWIFYLYLATIHLLLRKIEFIKSQAG